MEELLIDESLQLINRIIFFEYFKEKELLVMPDNHGEIIIPLENNVKINILSNRHTIQVSQSKAYYLSPRRKAMNIVANSGFLVLKVNPIFHRQIISKLSEEAFGIYALHLNSEEIDQIITFCNSQQKIGASELIFENLLIENPLVSLNEMILESIERIKNRKGNIKIQEIYSSLRVSKSKLEQHFNLELGMTPKEFCKIEKINHFIRSYFKLEGYSLTELTYKCGYYDQSHLIKDFKYFSDISPKRFFESSIILKSDTYLTEYA